MVINITHLYPDLLNLYGDRGNIAALYQRLRWRGIDANVKTVEANDGLDLKDTDILLLGGGSDREQKIVSEKLLENKEKIKAYIEKGGVLLAICGGYQLLGEFYQTQTETLTGLGIIKAKTVAENGRLIGNVIIHSEIDGEKLDIVGFENHAGRTYFESEQPLGKVISGFGNNGKDSLEGVIYKNVFGTYLHGPLLPKNPKLTDIILSRALKNKYEDFKGLSKLDDTLEEKANKSVAALITK